MTEPKGRDWLARSPELVAALSRQKGTLATVLTISAALNLLLLSGSLFMMLVYDEVMPSRSAPSLVGLLFILLIAFAFQATIDHLRNQIAGRVAELFEQSLADRVFGLLLDGERAGTPRGEATQPVRDLDQLRNFLSGPGPMALLDLPWMLLFLAVLFGFHYLLGLVALAGAAILVVMTLVTDRATARQVESATGSSAVRSAYAEACRRNADTLRALGMQGNARTGWREVSAAHAVVNGDVNDKLSAARTFSRTFRLLLQSLILACGAWLVIEDQASGGVIFASSILAARMLAPIDQAIGNWRGLAAARQAWNRLAARLAATPHAIERTALPRPVSSLSVENLAAAAAGSQVVLFRDIAFSLSAGDTLAIVGSSGSGKSSLAWALVGALAPFRGAVRLDGAAIEHWDPDVLGAAVGYVPQDIDLLDGTVAQNIARFDASATSEEIVAAARDAGIHDLVVRLPEAYETLVGPSGRPLSGGQRQRVALARALFRKPFLLVLDEPNSNLDSSGDTALNSAIAAARDRGAIVIMVAHRPSALTEMGKMLWLEGGMVKAFGPKAEVLPKLNGPAPAKPARALAAVKAEA